MIPLSAVAEAQLDSLMAHYVRLDRQAAADRLVASLERASTRIEDNQERFLDAPRPYPALTQKGWRWTKEGVYWIAFVSGDQGPVIVAVFHEAADIPNRI